MVDVVIDDMTIGNPVSPLAQRWRFWASIRRHPYSAVPFPGNWELWRKCPDASQHFKVLTLRRGPYVGRKLGSEWYFSGRIGRFWEELSSQLPVGGAHNMTVPCRWRLRDILAQWG